jgi:thiol:disulfide interchange protein DsbA
VLEVFSYGCPACDQFQPTIERLRHDLPPNAQLRLLPASVIPTEDWPMLQRAYFTALSLGVAERTHQGIFDAIWKTRELAIVDPATNRLKSPLPSIEDAARVYEKIGGVSADKFLQVARSFGVDARMRVAHAQIMAMQVHSTPTLIVNGRYRVIRQSDSYDDLIGLIRHLVSMESAR